MSTHNICFCGEIRKTYIWNYGYLLMWKSFLWDEIFKAADKNMSVR